MSSEIIKTHQSFLNILNVEQVWTSDCSLWKELLNKYTSKKGEGGIPSR